jgi:hypothetical protein
MNAKQKLDEFNELLKENSRALVKAPETPDNALVAYEGDDGFAAAAAEADSKTLKGELIKFVDGVWTVGGTPVPAGTQFVPERVFACWVRWDDRKPVEYVWPRPSGLLPGRDTLSHLEEGDWPAGIDGEPSDPWRNTRYIWLLDPATMQSFTHTNSTVGMRLAYEALGRAVATMRKAHPTALPIVELSSQPMKTKRGTKLRPHFAVVGWRGVGGPPQIENDMNDALPF